MSSVDFRVLIGGEQLDEIAKIAKQHKVSLNDVVQHALALENLCQLYHNEGGKVLLQSYDGDLREVVLDINQVIAENKAKQEVNHG